MKTNTQKKAKISLKTGILITVAAIVFIAMSATIIYLLLQKDDKEIIKKDNRPTVVTEANVDEVVAAMDEPVPDGSYEISMNTKWTFDGNSSNAYVENSVSNTRTVYFDVTLADTGDLIYSSPYIPVGEKVEGFSLDSKLESGSYAAVVTYHLVDDNKEEVSNLSVTVTFQVN